MADAVEQRAGQESFAFRVRLCCNKHGLFEVTMTLPEADVEVTSSGLNLVEAIERGAVQVVEQLTVKGYEVTLNEVISTILEALEESALTQVAN